MQQFTALACAPSTVRRRISGHCHRNFTSVNFNLPYNKCRFCNFSTKEAAKCTIIKKDYSSEHNSVRWVSCRCCSHLYSIGHCSDSCVLNPRHSTRVVRINESLSCQVEQLGPFRIHMVWSKHGVHDMGTGVSHGSAYEGRHILGCDVTYPKNGGRRFLRYLCSCLPD